ncbi:hypothetical protein [Halochromatium roseum]|uniref:hypothetical protein n=1 Tax=Halochromatium roseum TaxID=391920 RepID=UPI001912BDB7|nr:hypothetical protein [Halochromatium roseum]MBK5940150.1 hypothetical protein [Halochromatium roseum]
MKISDLVRFNDERFFDGAVQLRWVRERPELAREAASAFVFHGHPDPERKRRLSAPDRAKQLDAGVQAA